MFISDLVSGIGGFKWRDSRPTAKGSDVRSRPLGDEKW